MATTSWRWQVENTSWFGAASVISDGSIVVGGREIAEADGEDEDFVAFKLNATNGSPIWKWKEGSVGYDVILDVAGGADGSVVLAGYTLGSWNATNEGDEDYAVVKLNSEGDVLWRWQSGTDSYDMFMSVAVGADGSVFLGGTLSYKAHVAKLDSNGNKLWTWTGDYNSSQYGKSIALAEDGQSVVLALDAYGDWEEENAGKADFAAVKLTISDGQEIWKWQNGTDETEYVESVLLMNDGSIIMSGYTNGSFSGPSLGGMDFAAWKLDANGTEVWRWQDGTADKDILWDSTTDEDGYVVLAGSTDGNWNGRSAGGRDFAAVRLDAINGSAKSWSWQDGTELMDSTCGTAAVSEGSVVLVGATYGSFAPTNTGTTGLKAIAMLLETTLGITPTPSLADGTSESTEHQSPNLPIPVIIVIVSAVALILGGSILFGYTRRRIAARSEVGGVRPNPEGVELPSVSMTAQSSNDGRSTAAATNVQSGTAPVAPRGQRPKWIRQMFLPNAKMTSAAARNLPGVFPPLPSYDAVTEQTSNFQRSNQRVGVGGDLDAGRGHQKRIIEGSTGSSPSESKEPSGETWIADNGALSTPPHHQRGKWAPSSPDCTPKPGIAEAMLRAAQEVAQTSTVPGLSDAAAIVSVLVNLAIDTRENHRGGETRLRWCWSLVTLLRRANDFLGEGDPQQVEAAGYLLDDLVESVSDLVKVIETYKKMNSVSKALTASLYRRHQEEAESAIHLAVNRLQMGLQLQSGCKFDKFVKEFKGDLRHQGQVPERTLQASVSEHIAEALASSRRRRRQRRLDKLEISKDHLTLSDEFLGRGGFGVIYKANYNGRNAAAKVVEVQHDLGGSVVHDDHDEGLEGQSPDMTLNRHNLKRRAFLREVEAMSRLKSPYIVHVYGVMTSDKERLIMVMEHMSGGDLRAFLNKSVDPISEGRIRRIIGDICAGMTFLHEKLTVHGDFKSPNVLFDGYGKAKISDFGTSQLTVHDTTTGLLTNTKQGLGVPMSIPWAAPETMDGDGSTFKSDVYSFGIVVWEVLTRKVPWAGETKAQKVFCRVVLKGERPPIPSEAPAYLADMARACWITDPEKRPTFSCMLAKMRLNGWGEP